MKTAALCAALWACCLPWAAADTAACTPTSAYQGAAAHSALPARYFPLAIEGTATPTPLPIELTRRLDQRMVELLRQTGAPAFAAAMNVPGAGATA